MGKKNRKKSISSKVPKQKFPHDSKIPKQKLPKDKIPKQQIRDEDFLPPDIQKTRKTEPKPVKSRFRDSRESGKNRGIPKQKIPKSKIPKQNTFSSTEAPNYIPQEEKSKTKKTSIKLKLLPNCYQAISINFLNFLKII